MMWPKIIKHALFVVTHGRHNSEGKTARIFSTSSANKKPVVTQKLIIGCAQLAGRSHLAAGWIKLQTIKLDMTAIRWFARARVWLRQITSRVIRNGLALRLTEINERRFLQQKKKKIPQYRRNRITVIELSNLIDYYTLLLLTYYSNMLS